MNICTTLWVWSFNHLVVIRHLLRHMCISISPLCYLHSMEHSKTTVTNHSQQLRKVQGVLSHQEVHEGPKRKKQGQEGNISCI